MFLELSHKRMDVYICANEMVFKCREIVKGFPMDERFVLVAQIRRASLSVLLNIAEGASRKSDRERKRFYQIARSSLVEVDAGFDAAKTAGYLQNTDINEFGTLVVRLFQMLTGMINKS